METSTPISQVASTPVTTSQATRPSSAQALTSDFDTFLKMLTAQAKYQDPLEPIDSTEYAAQLAQFSMVEQQVQTNETLTSLFGQLGARNAASLSAWVGMEARAVTPVEFDGTPITLAPIPAANADSVTLVVKDGTGSEVQRQIIALSSDPIEWDGVDANGAPLPFGTYSFELESQNNGTLLQTDPVAVYNRVTEAQIDGDEVQLILAGGHSVPTSAVTALRDPVSLNS